MKLVLLSVIIVISVVQVSGICTKVSSQEPTKEARCTPVKEEKYSMPLRTDDPPEPPSNTKEYQLPKFSSRNRFNMFRERRRITKEANFNTGGTTRRRNVKRNHRSRHAPGKRQRRFEAREIDDDNDSPPDGRCHPFHSEPPALSFGSPEQLQEYLCSEAAHAKHILRSGPAFQSRSLGRDSEYYPKSSIADDLESFDEGPTSSKKQKPYSNSNTTQTHYHVHSPPKKISKNKKPNPLTESTKKEGHSQYNYDRLYKMDNSFPDTSKYSYPYGKEFSSPTQLQMSNEGFLEEERHHEYPTPRGVNPPYFVRSETFPDQSLGFRSRPSSFIHPFDAPYIYPPPWFGARPPYYMPKIAFAYPYDRRRYEGPPHRRKTPKDSVEKSESPLGDDLVKLKLMIDELDSLSEGAKEGWQKSGKKDGVVKEQKANDTVTEVKDKIDKIVIPILSKISKDLNSNWSANLNMVKRAEMTGDKERDKGKDGEMEAGTNKDLPCKLDGLWIGRNEGLQLNITTLPNMTMKVSIVSNNSKSSGISKDWTISGITLASFGGPFMFAAVYPEKKKIANFSGQCRTCCNEDVIFGLWTFSTAGKDCTDLLTAVETKLDVFRRRKVNN